MEQLSDLADTYMTPRLSQVSGVGHVTVQGNMRPAVRIQADLARLASYGISMETLRTAIAEANVTGAKGTLNGAAAGLHDRRQRPAGGRRQPTRMSSSPMSRARRSC